VDLGHCDAAQPVPTTRDASDDASNPAPVTQDFRYLIYYVWSELPPAEKRADIVLSSLKDTPVGTLVEETKRASDAFGRCTFRLSHTIFLEPPTGRYV